MGVGPKSEQNHFVNLKSNSALLYNKGHILSDYITLDFIYFIVNLVTLKKLHLQIKLICHLGKEFHFALY